MNQHLIAYYLHKILPAQQNYKTYDAELLAIVQGFKTLRHYFKRAAYIILIFINYINLKKFMETTCLSSRQIRWAQELLCYNFKINYHPETKNPAYALSYFLTNKDTEKELFK